MFLLFVRKAFLYLQIVSHKEIFDSKAINLEHAKSHYENKKKILIHQVADFQESLDTDMKFNTITQVIAGNSY